MPLTARTKEIRSARYARVETEPADSPFPLSAYSRRRGTLDRIIALLLLIPGLPIMVLTILLVRLTSPGPGIYRQIRVGLRGRTYTMLKIRTMRVDAESGTGPVWTQRHDPRITRIGRLVRKLHLDEFPQLINVVRGEMALVGPRPERPEFVQYLAREIPGYMDRLLVYPGITGLAQINLPPDDGLESVRRKLVLDKEYVAAASLSLDLRIVACTFFRLLGIHGTFSRRILGLQRWPRVEHASLLDAGEGGASNVALAGAPLSVRPRQPR
jgi:lipopolysaccharide/colanic/teichoic acid biosynthesis glycosyltransferase